MYVLFCQLVIPSATRNSRRNKGGRMGGKKERKEENELLIVAFK